VVQFRQWGRVPVRMPPGGGRQGVEVEKEAVECHRQAGEEKQRGEVLRYQWKDGRWQRDLNGIAVPAGKIVNHASEEHIKKAATNLFPPVRSRAARQLHLRNGLAAKGALG